METVFLISANQEVEVLKCFVTTIHGYECPAYTVVFPDGTIGNVTSSQVITHLMPKPVTSTASALRELYEEIKHGDEAHQKWLKDKIEDFIERKELI